MKRSTIRFIIILGTISIIGIIIIQIYWMQKTYNIKETQFHQSVNIVLNNVTTILFDYSNEIYEESCDLPYENPVLQISSDYYIVNVNCEIDIDILEYYLITEFENRNLKIDFEYGVYDCTNDNMTYGNYISLKQDPTLLFEKSDLQKSDEFTYYFGVYFPDHSNYIIGNMNILYFFSVILILIIIFFAYSLSVILRQRRLSEVQKDFINNMTHEFKTPISSIAISVDVLAEPLIIKEPERITKYTGIIKEQNTRLKNQVEKVLNMAEIEKNKIQLQKKKIDLNIMLPEIVKEFKLSFPNKYGEIKINLNHNNQKILADELHFSNILFNIIDNAYKYCKNKPVVNINTALYKNKIILSVADNGIGIKKEHFKRIFQTFYRVPTGNIHDVKGFGLGLNYVSKMINAHKWKISVSSIIDTGTVFNIYIPYIK
jgi:two-component system phosphate regulon sensor histidine kinase PhoR